MLVFGVVFDQPVIVCINGYAVVGGFNLKWLLLSFVKLELSV